MGLAFLVFVSISDIISGMDNNLSENDPYRGMNSGSDSIRPDFLGKQDGAAKDLKSAEKAASGEIGKKENSVSGVKDGEEKPGKIFTGSGKKSLSGPKSFGGKFKGMFKKHGPLVAIFMGIVGAGALAFGGQSLMPVAISEMIIQKLNSIGVSSTITSDVWLDTQLNTGIRPEGEEVTEENKFAFSQYQVRSFAAQGMKLTDEDGVTKLMYRKTDREKSWVAVVGSEHAGAGISVEEALSDRDFVIPYTAAAKGWRGGSSGWFDTMMNNITSTKLSITRNRWASYTARSMGKMTDQFLELAKGTVKDKTSDAKVEASKEMNREEYEAATEASYKQAGRIDDPVEGGGPIEEGSTIVAYDHDVAPEEGVGDWDSAQGLGENGEALTVTNLEKYGYLRDENGNLRYDDDGAPMYGLLPDDTPNDQVDKFKIEADNSDAVVNDVADVGVLESKLMNKAMGVAGAAATAANVGCAVIEGLMSIYTVASAYQSLQFLNLVSGFLESVDKMKAGSGTESPIHEYSTNLTTAATTSAADGESNEGGMKTAMESEWMSWLFSDKPINSNDPSVKNTNFESVMAGLSGLTSNITLTADVFEKCGYVKVAAAGAELVLTGMSFIPIIGGAAKLSQVAMKIGAKVVTSLVVQTFFSIAIPIIAKKIINSVVKNAATEWFGEDLGNAMLAGAGKYLGGNGTSGGQSAGSMEKVMAYLGEQQTVIAKEAEYQRAVKSPFDITSPYTFLGSLAYAVMPMAYSSGGVSSAVTNMSTLTSNAIAAISPGASAVELGRKIDSVGECPLLENMGAVGDASCNEYVITDPATIREAPLTVKEQVADLTDENGQKALNEDGTINDKSDLAKYITFCGQRTSQLGLKDSGIVDKLQDGVEKTEDGEGQEKWYQKAWNWLGKVFSVTPGISETQNVLESIRDARLMQWATGEACVASDENPYWNGEKSSNQTYQRYMENERLIENINPGYKSTVTMYLEDYYEKNPIDDSFEGQLARFSGMSKDEVTGTLALIVYYDQLAKYNPEERYAFNESVDLGDGILFNNENAMAINGESYLLVNNVVYADVRNRQNMTA